MLIYDLQETTGEERVPPTEYLRAIEYMLAENDESWPVPHVHEIKT